MAVVNPASRAGPSFGSRDVGGTLFDLETSTSRGGGCGTTLVSQRLACPSLRSELCFIDSHQRDVFSGRYSVRQHAAPDPVARSTADVHRSANMSIPGSPSAAVRAVDAHVGVMPHFD